jgi:uncharacterized protein (DUF1800 family)
MAVPIGLAARSIDVEGSAFTRVAEVPPPPPASAPATVNASASNARVVIEWTPVDGASGYQVFSTTTGVWDVTPVARVGRTRFTHNGLTNGQMYAYRVVPYNRGGTGPSSSTVSAMPLAPPLGVVALGGDQRVTVSWEASAGASSYTVYRSVSWEPSTFAPVATSLAALSLLDMPLTNGTKYYYRVRAVADGGVSELSARVYATPQPPPPADPPANLVARAGNAKVDLSWDAVTGATSYRIFRTTTGVWDATPLTSTRVTTFRNTGLTNGTAYSYKVVPRNAGGDGPASAIVTATPVAPPAAPTDLSATAGDQEVTLSWTAVEGAASYNVYRGTAPNRQARVAVASGVPEASFVDRGVTNGPTYYYKVTAANAGGESPRSAEVSASPEAPAPPIDPATVAAFRMLRQATWGPRPDDVEALKTSGVEAFLDDQFAAASSEFPDSLFEHSVEATQEHFMQVALTGPDQLRQRVAWALHKIWVVSAVEVDRSDAIVTYYRALSNGAFGNYRDLMGAITLNPAMGRYLNMLNNRSQQVTGVPPNENYPRELMQLFSIGLSALNANGTAVLDGDGRPIPTFTEADVQALARILTGWTFGDGDPATLPRRLARRENYRVPMEVVERFHDAGAKTFLGQQFPAGQSALQDLEQALDVLFNHPNVGPFVSRQLIQQLVTSNPSPAYVAAIAGVFADNGGGVRGDMAAVVRAILTHPDAATSTTSSGKLAEPVLFVVSQLRALNASVTDHPFMSDKVADMGQKVFYPPSVFSYFSPGFRVRGTAGPGGAPLVGPEFQILTSVTALERANFVGALVGGHFGDDVSIDYAPFTSRASDPAALVDYVNLLMMGGQMSLEERTEIIAAVRVSPATQPRERVRTAVYLTLVAAQSQVDR